MFKHDGKMAATVLFVSLLLSSSAFGLTLANTLHKPIVIHQKSDQPASSSSDLQGPIQTINFPNEISA